MVVKPHVRVLFLGAIIVFVFNKFVSRLARSGDTIGV